MGEEKVNTNLYPDDSHDSRGAYNEDGVDVSHIDSFLEKTPGDRLRDAHSAARFFLKVRALNSNA